MRHAAATWPKRPPESILTPRLDKIFTLQPSSRHTIRLKAASLVGGVLDRALQFDRIDQVYAAAAAASGEQGFFESLLLHLRISCPVRDQDLERIPASGPVVVVSNHPFGLVDPIVLFTVLHRVRPDVKVLTNFVLSKLPELHPACIFVDPFGDKNSLRHNFGPLKEALRWLSDGHLLAIFPAGEVASANLRHWKITEPPWSETVAGLIRRSKATVVPVFFRGTNSPLFHAVGFIHPRLRTALLPHEMLTKRGRTIQLVIGNAIPFRRMEQFESDAALMHHLRERAYLLRSRRAVPKSNGGAARRWMPSQPLALSVSPEVLAGEISRLPADRKLVEHGGYQVYFALAHEIPYVLREIGRLREMTFRVAGEGTGKARDLDEFDDYYVHLFLVHEARREIVGAYRMGRTDEILARLGVRGLYTNTLFEMAPALLERLNPSLELGRSFVRPEYQRTSAALALLWRGLGRYVVGEPRYRVLFGPVSISNDYHKVSHQLMVSFLRRYSFMTDEAKLVRARRAFREHKRKGWTLRFSRLVTSDLDDVSSLVSDIEADGKGIPVLLRQYLHLGGRILGFNVDTEFSNVVDSLILVDLAQTDRRVLERYMGKDGATAFLAHHAAAVNSPVL